MAAARQVAQDVQQTVDEMFKIPLVGQIIAGEPIHVPPFRFSLFRCGDHGRGSQQYASR